MTKHGAHHVWTTTEERYIRQCYRRCIYYGIINDIAEHLELPRDKVMNHINIMRKEGRL